MTCGFPILRPGLGLATEFAQPGSLFDSTGESAVRGLSNVVSKDRFRRELERCPPLVKNEPPPNGGCVMG